MSRAAIRYLGIGALLLALAIGCSKSEPRSSGSGDTSGGDAGGDADVCTAGAVSCSCDGGTCVPGTTCQDDTCVACTETLGCTCAGQSDCDDTEVCLHDVCVACTPRAEGCICGEGDVCDEGLECQDGACVQPDCPPGQLGCACNAGACDEGNVCDSLTARCRAPASCTDQGCPPPQLCTSAASQDAVCLEDCDEGYVWDLISKSCVARSCSNTNCTEANLLCVDGGTGPVCEGCRPGFIDQGDGTCVRNPGVCADIRPECRALNRRCIELDSGGTTYAECGGCLAGFAVQPLNGECEPTVACADLDCATANRSCVDTDFSYCSNCLPDFIEDGGSCRPVVREEDLSCDAGEFAFPETPTSDAYCAAVPCAPGQAAMPDGSCDNTMFLCPASCTGTGQTGAVWPYRVATGLSAGVCFCETAPGYFYDLDKRAAVACDADADGWLKVTARAALMSPDAAVRANARCTPRLVDRVVLFNDVSQSETVVYCATGPMLRGPFDAACPALLPVPLYESDTIDDDTLLAGPAGPAPYGLGSRRLEAKELNSLTKACSGRNDDFNGNSIADVAEWGRAGLPFTNPNKVAALAPFQELAYFVELHRGGFVTSPYGPVGRYNIAERSRCHDTVPLEYAAGASSYAAECTRNRDARYDSTAGDSSQIGIDFGRFDCSAVAGSCPTPVPVVETFADPVPADASLGLCQDGVTIPTAWRGMMHHSQYQCVVATDSPVSPDPLVPYLHNVADFVTQSGAGNGSLQLNSCDASPYVEGAAGESAPLTVTCAPADGTAVSGEQVGFAAVLYNHTSSGEPYTRGCINECAEWGSVCPGFGVTAGCVDRTDEFGQLECNACPQTGAECDNPDPATAYGPCAKGVYACVDSNAVCDLDAEPQPEEGGEPGVDDDCDGLVDGTIAEAIFVDGAAGVDATGSGLAPETPAQSIEWGLIMARLSGRSVVLVAEGTYAVAGRIAVGAGVGPFVLEGYYRYDPSTNLFFHGPYTLRGGYSSSCAAGERWCYTGGAVTVTADVTVAVTSGGALSGDITVSGIDFVARNGTSGSRTSYGLLASGFGTGHTVRFEQCGFYAGNGRAGASGQAFANRATDGSDGEQGTMGCENEARAGCGSCDPPLGAAGGTAPTCANGNPSAGGGAGGSAAKGGDQGSAGSNGGNPAVGGAMGGMAGGGVPARLCDPNTLCAMSILPQLVLPVGGAVCNYKGQDGGSPMTPLTAGAISCTTFDTGGQADSVGTRGAGGYAGAGGGGGGGGGGGTSACNSYGGSGGGGGSGGCGGAGGRGGHNGGGSYAAFVRNAAVVFSNCVLQAGNGGKGGEGGAGQAGGLGGLGGYLKAGILQDPWPELEAGLLEQCKSTMYGGTGAQDDASHGAMGGKGGDGQDGANGGPGAGGPSIALMTWGGSANVTLEGDNTLQVGTPGSSGQTSAGQNIQAPAVLQGNEATFPCNN